ncbi:hypothetical protein [Trichloromonas sp.]|uniref:hypothetical protein n=1 Tax=Trichloromonas sp. TaxID=3069249 RepID=UPI002A4B40C8|nr:hypothetical protein [Trichloromonas sp.]
MTKKINSMISFIFFIVVGCGGGGGGGSDSVTSNDSELQTPGIFEKTYDILNSFIKPTENHGASLSSTGALGNIYGCSEEYGISEQELHDFAKEESDYSLCGTQQDNTNRLCIYPGENSYRTVENSSSLNYPDAMQEKITIILPDSQVLVTNTYYNEMNYEAEYEASNVTYSCNDQYNPPNTTYTNSDIFSNYQSLAIDVNHNGTPITSRAGDLTCNINGCEGIVKISNMEFNELIGAWEGEMFFDGSQYKMISTMSPNKQVIVFSGCVEQPPKNSSSCIYVGAVKK